MVRMVGAIDREEGIEEWVVAAPVLESVWVEQEMAVGVQHWELER